MLRRKGWRRWMEGFMEWRLLGRWSELEGYWAYEDLYYMDEYGYFQKQEKGKGKKGNKGKDDEGKWGKPGDGKGKSNAQPQTSSTPALQNCRINNNKLITLQQNQDQGMVFLHLLRLTLHVWMFWQPPMKSKSTRDVHVEYPYGLLIGWSAAWFRFLSVLKAFWYQTMNGFCCWIKISFFHQEVQKQAFHSLVESRDPWTARLCLPLHTVASRGEMLRATDLSTFATGSLSRKKNTT